MTSVKLRYLLTLLLAVSAYSQVRTSAPWGGLEAGQFAPGFRLIETSDASRLFPADDGGSLAPRPMRVYVWYPAKQPAAGRMRLDDYVRLALEDFRTDILPVPLTKGLEASDLKALLNSPAGAVRDAEAGPGKFPLLILGQGLYYESPLCHSLLCEFLASHGYVVATCPLLGTQYRLVNINVEDLETEVRDMEFVLAAARTLPFADAGKLGLIGYDLGGMAGLILSMRNPSVDAYLSMDSAIMDKHYSGLPNSHPGYREDRFRIPWMHMLQARFIRPETDRSAKPSLFERKAFGESYLVHVPTESHGDFSSYASMGILKAVPGYWDAPPSDPRALYEVICRMALAFFDACLRDDGGPLEKLLPAGPGADSAQRGFRIEHKTGAAAPPSEAELVHLLIENGLTETRPAIERIQAQHPDFDLVAESVLNWLGVHFLYWWGREEEAVGVFELNASLHAKSWRAHDSLGEAYAERGRIEEAIRSYKKSLELNPENSNARAALERLRSPAKKDRFSPF